MAINLKLNIDPNLNKIAIHDFNNICRLCSKSNDLVSILQNTYLIGMLKTLSNIQIKLNDELPKKICLNCVKDLNKSFSFISKCKATDAAYKQCVNRQKTLMYKTQEEIKPKSTEEVFIKTEITDNIEEYNDPLSVSGEWTQDPLGHQENPNQQTKVEFEGGIIYIRNNQQIPAEIPRKKRKRSPNVPPEQTNKSARKTSPKKQKTNIKSAKFKGKSVKTKAVKMEPQESQTNLKENKNKKIKQEVSVSIKSEKRTKNA